MPGQIKQDFHDLALYDDLITSLITLKIILEDIDKLTIVKDLEINNKMKELEAEEDKEFRRTRVHNIWE